MLVPIYPAGHKKAGERKTEKDLTEQERHYIEDDTAFRRGRDIARARAIRSEQEWAKQVLQEASATA